MSKPTTRAEARPQSPYRLPYRGGSIQMRHGRWWLVYTDADGIQVQKNSKTAEPKAAFRQLVDEVIEVAMMRLDGLLELQRQLNEKTGAAEGPQQTDVRAQHGSVSRAVPAHAAGGARQKSGTRKGGR